jgi:thymidylate synthase
MEQYLDLMRRIRDEGHDRKGRTEVGTRAIFGPQMEFPLDEYKLPTVTTKKIIFRSLIHELVWFLRGESNISYLTENKVNIWNNWADDEGELGPVYGVQWRSWPTYDGGFIDQISKVIDTLINDRYSRRHIVSSWNVAMIEEMALPPCHLLFQFYVEEDRLSCKMYQRSADFFLGVPFNITSYSLLTMMVAHVTGYKPGKFIHTFGDTHLYLNHLEQVEEQLSRKPLELPGVVLNPDVKSILDFNYEDIQIKGYKHHPFIRAEISE